MRIPRFIKQSKERVSTKKINLDEAVFDENN